MLNGRSKISSAGEKSSASPTAVSSGSLYRGSERSNRRNADEREAQNRTGDQPTEPRRTRVLGNRPGGRLLRRRTRARNGSFGGDEFFVIRPLREDRIDVANRLGAARESVLHNRIVVDGATRLANEPVADVVPRFRIVAMLLCEPNRILHVTE